MCWALTRLIVHPMMKELGFADGNDAEILKHRMAWDMSESAARTNKQEDTRQAYDRGLAGGRVVLKTTGLSVTDDAMTDAEFINFVGRKNNNPYLELFGRPGTEDIDWEQVKAYSGKTGPGADSEGADPNAGPGVGDPGSPNDSKKPTKRSPS
jgi:hypothetical protein